MRDIRFSGGSVYLRFSFSFRPASFSVNANSYTEEIVLRLSSDSFDTVEVTFSYEDAVRLATALISAVKELKEHRDARRRRVKESIPVSLKWLLEEV